MEAALTPPMNGTTSAERRAAIRALYRSFVRGSSTQGRKAPGSAAAEVEPTTMVKVGHSAYATAASSRDAPVPTRNRSASRSAPQKATDTTTDNHSRSTSHTGNWRACPSQ
ncbi:hypothetical protein M2162_005603 [Streptomyces sp. SAI-041]|nr:hypothetical protein [Streptomyces sp. SAI-041]